MDEGQDKLYKLDDGGACRFWWETQKSTHQSERLNRPVYDEVLLMEIFTPGSRESSPVYEVVRRFDKETKLSEHKNEGIHERYGKQIDAFRNNEDTQDLTGTPLDQFPAIDRSMAASLREQRIFTVEGLAAIPDEKLRVLGLDGRTLRERAQAFLEAAAGGAGTAAILQQLADQGEQIAALTARAEAAEAALASKGGEAPAPAEAAPEAAPEAATEAAAKPAKVKAKADAPDAVENSAADGNDLI